ncbi:MAG: alpha/beta fold hydrolase [Myxococcota bacterium]
MPPTEPHITTLGVGGPAAHVYLAMGFTDRSYQRFLSALAERLKLASLALRPARPDVEPPPSDFSWQLYADDLIDHLERYASEPVIGIGHSLGATSTIFAASRRPDLFRALVLIESAFLSRPKALAVRWVPFGIARRFQPVRGVFEVPDAWPSLERAVEYFRTHRAYRRIPDADFIQVVDGMLMQRPGGDYVRAFSPAWEARSYARPPYAIPALRRIELPVVLIRARPSVFMTPPLWKEMIEAVPHARVREFPEQGHFLPLEIPVECAHAVLEELEAVGVL